MKNLKGFAVSLVLCVAVGIGCTGVCAVGGDDANEQRNDRKNHSGIDGTDFLNVPHFLNDWWVPVFSRDPADIGIGVPRPHAHRP